MRSIKRDHGCRYASAANVGENVLIVQSQANRDSRPHLIGGHGDDVRETDKFSDPPETGLEIWFIRGGSAGAKRLEDEAWTVQWGPHGSRRR